MILALSSFVLLAVIFTTPVLGQSEIAKLTASDGEPFAGFALGLSLNWNRRIVGQIEVNQDVETVGQVNGRVSVGVTADEALRFGNIAHHHTLDEKTDEEGKVQDPEGKPIQGVLVAIKDIVGVEIIGGKHLQYERSADEESSFISLTVLWSLGSGAGRV